MLSTKKVKTAAGLRWIATATAAAATTAAFAAPAQAAGPAADRASAADVAVVVTTQAATLARAQDAVRSAGGRVTDRMPVLDALAARVPAHRLAALRRASGVHSVSRDRKFSARTDAADASGGGVPLGDVRATVGAAGLDPDRNGGAGVDVALVDTGVVPVPGLDQRGHVVHGPDFSSDAPHSEHRNLDGFGHGTHLAGVIAARGADAATTGVAPGARVVSVKVAGPDGDTSLSRLMAGIERVIRHGDRRGLDVRVLNLAFGAETEGGCRSDPLAFAVEKAWRKGIVVVTSAGNGGPQTTSLDSPAYDPYVIAVGAQDTRETPASGDDEVAEFSSRGSAERSPDVLAPGVRVISARVPGSFLDMAYPEARAGEHGFRGSGSSQSAAVVAGSVALLLERRPDLSPDQVKALLRASAQPLAGTDQTLQGAGVVNVAGAAESDAVSADQQWPRARAGLWRGVRGPSLELAVEDPDGSRWGGSRWGGSRWGGASWDGSRWGGSRWGGASWDGSRWGGSRWGGASWDGSRWGGSRWGGASWSMAEDAVPR